MTTSEDFELRTEASASGSTLVVVGEIDMLTGSRFATAVTDAVRAADGRLCLDLTGVEYFGSEGVQGVVRAAQLAQKRDVAFELVPSTIVAHSLEVSGLADLIG